MGVFFWFVLRTFRGIVLVTKRERLPNRIYGVSLRLASPRLVKLPSAVPQFFRNLLLRLFVSFFFFTHVSMDK